MTKDDAIEIMSKLGDYNALNFANKPLEPFTDLVYRNFKIVPIDKKTPHEEFTVMVSFENTLHNPSIYRETNYLHFIKENNWEEVIDLK